MLTDVQLTELCDKMGIPLELICFKDELPKKLKYNKSYIINIDDSEDADGNPNEGTHWTCLQINKYKNDKIEPFYFDSYGMPPAEIIKKSVLNTCGQKLPFNTKDVQSLMNNACGFYVTAFLHYINECPIRTRNLYQDVENFLDMFDDLNKSVDFKKNEYILKHFFVPKDRSLRREIEIDTQPNRIISAEGINMMQIGVDVKQI
jgi:hypothetical protein